MSQRPCQAKPLNFKMVENMKGFQVITLNFEVPKYLLYIKPENILLVSGDVSSFVFPILPLGALFSQNTKNILIIWRKQCGLKM